MTLFHYCSTETFVAIVSNRAVRLSSLRLSNDTSEGRLVRAQIKQLAIEESVASDVLSRLEKSFESFETLIDGLGFCLSEEGDLLSQWRGYADDANGLSIGFSNEYLRRLADSRVKGQSGFSLHQVRYSLNEHRMHVKPLFDEFRSLIAQGAFRDRASVRGMLDSRSDEEFAAELEAAKKIDQALHMRVMLALPLLYELKSPAFREEREWRLVSVSGPFDDTAKFRAARNRIIPYRDYELRDMEVSAIERVYLGPRNITPPSVVKSLLKNNGFGDVEVVKSEASYR